MVRIKTAKGLWWTVMMGGLAAGVAIYLANPVPNIPVNGPERSLTARIANDPYLTLRPSDMALLWLSPQACEPFIEMRVEWSVDLVDWQPPAKEEWVDSTHGPGLGWWSPVSKEGCYPLYAVMESYPPAVVSTTQIFWRAVVEEKPLEDSGQTIRFIAPGSR